MAFYSSSTWCPTNRFSVTHNHEYP
jgi:hypothetical protein